MKLQTFIKSSLTVNRRLAEQRFRNVCFYMTLAILYYIHIGPYRSQEQVEVEGRSFFLLMKVVCPSVCQCYITYIRPGILLLFTQALLTLTRRVLAIRAWGRYINPKLIQCAPSGNTVTVRPGVVPHPSSNGPEHAAGGHERERNRARKLSQGLGACKSIELTARFYSIFDFESFFFFRPSMPMTLAFEILSSTSAMT